MSKEKVMKIANPLVIMFQGEQGDVLCHIHPQGHTYEQYGLLVCDLVRHVAAAFNVEEDKVWEWVDKERDHPTIGITQVQ